MPPMMWLMQVAHLPRLRTASGRSAGRASRWRAMAAGGRQRHVRGSQSSWRGSFAAAWRSLSTSSGTGRRVDPAALRAQFLDDLAPRLLALGRTRLADRPRRRRRADRVDGAGARRRAAGARVRLDLARRPRHARAVRSGARATPASGAPATSSPSRCTATTATTSTRAPRDWPDGTRSPGIITLTRLRQAAGVDDETFYGHWYGHQSPMSEGMQPRARYVRNAVVRALTPGAPRYRAIVEEAWPTRRAPHRPAHVLRRDRSNDELGETHPHHARQHQAALRPRDDAQLHAERVHPQDLSASELGCAHALRRTRRASYSRRRS